MRMFKEQRLKINKNYNALLAIIIIVGSAMLFNLVSNGFMHGKSIVEVEIASGATTSDIADAMYNKGIIKSKVFFRILSRLTSSDGQYKSGIVALTSDMSYFQIINQLKSNVRVSIKITIPEGFELKQIADTLEAKGLINKERFYTEIEKGEFNYSFLTDKLPQGKNRFEGYLFPATYNIHPGTSEHDIIDIMLKRFADGYPNSYIERAKEMGFTTHQIVTLASIIQREASNQLDLVSSVFHNRLKSKKYSRLQSCATVEYIIKERKKRLSVADTKVESPYNTYKYGGLPPGPICSPSEESIKAALYPAQTTYLFFTSVGNDNHVFSNTYDEHIAATAVSKENGN